MKKLIILLMSVCLAFTMMPAMAFAEAGGEPVEGSVKVAQNALTGWRDEGVGFRYYITETEYAKGFQDIGVDRYFFDGQGYLKIGWQTIEGKRYYFEEKGSKPATDNLGKMRTGWVKYNGYKFYFATGGAARGAMQTGWLWSKYYLDPVSGVMATGWKTISGAKYYFNLTSGQITKGWLNLNGARFYLDPGTGKLKTGWFNVGKGRYYADPKTGRIKTGWMTVGKKKYYFDPNTGKMETGLAYISKQHYYFDGSGVMKTGVVKVKKNLYYFMKDGKAVKKKGWFKGSDKKKRYCFGNGVIGFGYEKIGSTWYELNAKTGVYKATIGDDLDKQVYKVSSKNKQIVAVSRSNHIVRVYKKSKKKWKKVKQFTCSVGRSSSRTPAGTFTVGARTKVQTNSKKTVCWWYCTKFSGSRQFQSILYKYDAKNPPEPGKSKIEDGTLGGNVSDGDIRLSLENAKWIYDNVKSGTKVVIV